MNGAALCYGCHSYLGGRPSEHLAWFAAKVGLEEIERLKRTAKTPHYGIKKQIRAIGQFYKREYDEMRLGGQFRAWIPGLKFEVA